MSLGWREDLSVSYVFLTTHVAISLISAITAIVYAFTNTGLSAEDISRPNSLLGAQGVHLSAGRSVVRLQRTDIACKRM